MVTTNTRKKVCWSLCGKSIFVALTGGVLCIITYLRPLLYFKCFGTHYKGLLATMVTKGSYTPHGLVYWPIRGGLSPWALKKREAKERKSYSPAEGNLLYSGWSFKKQKDWQLSIKPDTHQSSPFVLLTVVNQALLLWWHASIIIVSRDFDRIEIEQKIIKKVDISVILDMKKHNTFGKSSTTP